MKLLGALSLPLLLIVAALAKPAHFPPPVQGSTIAATNFAETKTALTNLSALHKQAWALFKSNNLPAANKIFSDLYANDTNDYAALWGTASCRYLLKDYAGAAQSYSNYVILRPKSAAGHLWLGKALAQSQKIDAAERELRCAIELNSTNAETYDYLGFCLQSREEYAKAAATYDDAILLGGSTADRCVRGGVNYALATNYDRALPLLKRGTELSPTNYYGHEWLGRALAELHKFEEAEPELRRAIQLRPTNADPYDYLGWCLQSRKQFSEAAAVFEKAIQVGGESEYRCKNGGADYVRATNYDRAIPLLKRTVELVPTNYFGYHWLGRAYFHSGSYQLALTNFEKCLQVATNQPNTHYWLGRAYSELRNDNRAADEFAKELEADPEDSYTRKLCASALLRAHRETECIKMLEPYFHDNPKDMSARLDLLAAYLMHGDYRKAAKLYPIAFNVAAILLALGFIAGCAVLLRKSFQPSLNEHPHLAFAIGWLVLYFETQIALVFYAGLFTDAKMIAGLVLTPLPLFVAAFAFRRQPWGKPFTPPGHIAAKQIGTAFIAWVATLFIGGIYMTVLTKFTHYKPEARNIRFVMEIVHEHRALASIVVVFLAPIAEEILFRGLLFGALRKWLSPQWTIVITAIAFASIHLDIFYFLPIFLLGIVLGWARHTANSIWFSTAIHIVQNAIAFAAMSAQ